MKNLCYVFIRGAKPGERIGIVKRDVPGYYLTDLDWSYSSPDVVKATVAKMNERLGVTAEMATAMEIGSMFGWDVPGARKGGA